MNEQNNKGFGPILDLVGNDVVEVNGTHPAVRSTSFGGSSLVLKVKRISRARQSKLQEKHTRISKGRVEKFDSAGFANDVFDECLVGWNLRQSASEALPFTAENKAKVMEQSAELVGIVFSVATETAYVESASAEAEEALKGN